MQTSVSDVEDAGNTGCPQDPTESLMKFQKESERHQKLHIAWEKLLTNYAKLHTKCGGNDPLAIVVAVVFSLIILSVTCLFAIMFVLAVSARDPVIYRTYY